VERVAQGATSNPSGDLYGSRVSVQGAAIKIWDRLAAEHAGLVDPMLAAKYTG
jgi:hypothetical protein